VKKGDSKMKLKVLGSGSQGNCYLLEGESGSLLIEAGLPWKKIIKGINFNIENICGCLISHEHLDHSKAIADVLNNGIDVYASKGTIDACKVSGYRIHIVESKKQFTVGSFTVMPFQTEHDAAEPLGFLVQHEEMGKLLFITDSYYCRYKFSGLAHIMVECNYSMDILNSNLEKGLVHPAVAKRLLTSHFNLENVKEFLKVTDLSMVKEIVLLHLSDNNSDEKMFVDEIEKLTGKPVYVADRGLKIGLF
jgi:phosphoribosyl 1,2-cyclic phosphodiesterase